MPLEDRNPPESNGQALRVDIVTSTSTSPGTANPPLSSSTFLSTSTTANLLASTTLTTAPSTSASSGPIDLRTIEDWIRQLRKAVLSRGRWSVAFVGWAVAAGSVVVCLVGETWRRSRDYYTIYETVTSIELIVSTLFSIHLCFSAIRNENFYEVLGAMGFSLGTFVFTCLTCITPADLVEIRDELRLLNITSYSQITNGTDCWYTPFAIRALSPYLDTWIDSVRGVDVATVVMAGVQLVVQCALAGGVYSEIGWKVFRKMGADRAMKRRYRSFNLLMLLIQLCLYFHIFCALNLTVHNVKVAFEGYGSILFTVLTAVCYVMLVIGLGVLVWSVTREVIEGVIFFVVVAMAFVGVLTNQLSSLWRIDPDFSKDKDFLVRTLASYYATMEFLLVILCTTTSIVCAQNFGHGLKKYINVPSGSRKVASQGNQDGQKGDEIKASSSDQKPTRWSLL
ncbi:hypothetical protein M427DRAFT_362475 [Gonapodya prolifera JEL478]|uniref:Uncharacterized protein n=1 Tax=Gonapodya prolifera (strain JEL478) TaxID=1344416 RepID=A0A139AA25_GONPJ|nr:hypothetical protein M427DRAFT_362475 [Gonapodya prolifera JEL478]|eukprot:KXS13702.1 hypothetical protein M427DRAFT_362475 [Gonapodya prolifera JEL478]